MAPESENERKGIGAAEVENPTGRTKTMRKAIMMTMATLVLAMGVAVPQAQANEAVRGQYLAIALADFPDTIPAGAAVTGTMAVKVFVNGSTQLVPVTITRWVETPLGRATLGTETRSLKPGTNYKTNVSLAYNTVLAPKFESIEVTFGITVSTKLETLEATHLITIFQ
jgi:hypothetical protein